MPSGKEAEVTGEETIQSFLEEYEELCRKHGMFIGVCHGCKNPLVVLSSENSLHGDGLDEYFSLLTVHSREDYHYSSGTDFDPYGTEDEEDDEADYGEYDDGD